MGNKKRILVAITGASGLAYSVRLVEELKKGGHDVKVVVSEAAEKVAEYEHVKLPKRDYSEKEMDAPFASGSYMFDGMIVAPCSLKTLGEIANGIDRTLISRAAEVCLKERRKLVLLVRETPLSLIAIENMKKVTLAGGVVMPASPGFYSQNQKIDDLVKFMVGKMLDQFGVGHKLFKRWGENEAKR
ncbi:MAG: UbiX family flavin prenyltransferase [Candidatus Bilamarchaeaceae archaeon]